MQPTVLSVTAAAGHQPRRSVTAEIPAGVPEENWLPINRKDEDLSVNLRIYVPDEEKMKTWKAPSAELVK